MKKTSIIFLLSCLIVALGTQAVFAQPGVIEIINTEHLAIGQSIELKTKLLSDRMLVDAVYSIKGDSDIAIIEKNSLTARGQGSVTVAAIDGSAVCEKTFTISPYKRVCGASVRCRFCGPTCAWVDYNEKTGEIVNIEVSGCGHIKVLDDYGKRFCSESKKVKMDFIGLTAAGAINRIPSNSGDVAEAVIDACNRFLDPAGFSIRNYQTMMTGRYLANNPYFAAIDTDKAIETRILAEYPEGCAAIVTEDVYNGTKLTWSKGLFTATQKSGNASYKVSHNVIKAISSGIVLVEYRCGDDSVLDALEIYDNFTVGLGGSDSYGQVVYHPTQLMDYLLTYRVLGDKAMNFPGGTAGPTVVDVTIDRDARIIDSVRVAAHSDSTYLADPWEYAGQFIPTGNKLYDIATYCAKFKGLSANAPVAKYALTTAKAKGGLIVEGGIADVVTGATRTTNAIISAVNAAIEQFGKDVPK